MEACNNAFVSLTLTSNQEFGIDSNGKQNFHDGVKDNSQTPQNDVVFHPFAPPLHRTHHDHTANRRRRLAFRSPTTDEEEDHLFAIIYNILLDAFLSEQASDLDGSTTPESAPRLTGVAETCPPAPVKCSRKYRDLDKQVCRKLQF